ncbi:unnamed protein product [Phyllotreta striolata]|uniref:PDZ domain-containing protein n=1 Tax=Phyllotreta striolata TaxID=444603 RepID=A0A9N9THZ2_PHYSR|nr:unnamed protein product [Phyllotreta striolata]
MTLAENLIFPVFFLTIGVSAAQDDSSICYGPGSVASSVVFTFVLTCLLIWFIMHWRNKRRSKTDHLILETDPEKGKGRFAFDNPGFKEAAVERYLGGDGATKGRGAGLLLNVMSEKQGKKRSADDSAITENEVKVVPLRSEDFTGLGFNICGNMKEGIYVKEVMQRGPAFDSGKLNSGDRINSVTINFEHMVYSDALAILSYASPYEVVVEARGGRLVHNVPKGQVGRPAHPWLSKSSSHSDLSKMDKTSKWKSQDSNSSQSSPKKTASNATTLERKDSKSPQTTFKTIDKLINSTIDTKKSNVTKDQVQKSESPLSKFGVKVLPLQADLKASELKNVDTNKPTKIEQTNTETSKKSPVNDTKSSYSGINGFSAEAPESDKPPQAKKREKKLDKPDQFQRNSLNGSGIKRNADGIPLELPEEMLQAVTAVLNHRKSSIIQPEAKPETIQRVEEQKVSSDSDAENDSANTIELDSSSITVHQTEEEEKRQRKTLSTGDLSKMEGSETPNTGTLERAQSLDISDTANGNVSNIRKIAPEEDSVLLEKRTTSDDLGTFQRNRLKKSTEWGTLEDAVLKPDQTDSIQNEEEEEELAVKQTKNEIWPEIDNNTGRAINIKSSTLHQNLDNSIIDVDETQTNESNNMIHQELPLHTNGNDYDDMEIPVKKTRINNRIFEPFESVKLERNNRQRIPEQSPQPPDDFSLDTSPPHSLETGEIIPLKPSTPPRPEEVLSKIPLLNTMVKEISNSVDFKISKENLEKPTKHVSNVSVFNSPNGDCHLHSLEFSVNDFPLNSLEEDSNNKPVSPNEDKLETKSYITEIKVTPDEAAVEQDSIKGSNEESEKSLDEDFKRYVKSFEAKLEHFENNIHQFDKNLEDFVLEPPRKRNSFEKFADQSKENEELKDVNDRRKVMMGLENFNKNQLQDNEGKENSDSKCFIVNSPKIKEDLDDLVYEPKVIESLKSLSKNVVKEKELFEDIINDRSKVILGSEIFPKNQLNEKIDLKDNINDQIKGKIDLIKSEPILFEENEASKDQPNVIAPSESFTIDFSKGNDVFKERSNDVLILDKDRLIPKIRSDLPTSEQPQEKTHQKELYKIQKLAEQQLKKLPEIKFTTSSYSPSRIPEKRSTNVEQLKTNFEKPPLPSSQHSMSSTAAAKSRIPVAKTGKTPPTSPERRDSRHLDGENDAALLELMTSSITQKIKSPAKNNVTVTSIRANSKIPRKVDSSPEENSPLPTNGNGNGESSFKQWVFNPSNVTNVTVNQRKDDKN